MSSLSSTASLASFSVPLSDLGVAGSAQGILFPRLKNRFRVIFNGFGRASNSLILTQQIIDCSKPEVSFEEQTLDMYNSKIKYLGKPSWNDISITIRDSMDGGVQALVGQQLQCQFDFANQASATAPSVYKFETLIQELDGGNSAGTGEDPTVLSEFSLAGCWIKSASYDSLDVKDSGPVTVKLSIAYDNALQSSAGIGTVVAWESGTSAV